MRTIVKLVMALAVLTVFISGAVCAEYNKAASSAGQNRAAVIDAGNKICPVMGGKVSGANFYEYKGKRYGLCCPMCEAAFKADPEKYSAITDKEVTRK